MTPTWQTIANGSTSGSEYLGKYNNVKVLHVCVCVIDLQIDNSQSTSRVCWGGRGTHAIHGISRMIRRPSYSYNAGKEHVEFSPTRQALLALNAITPPPRAASKRGRRKWPSPTAIDNNNDNNNDNHHHHHHHRTTNDNNAISNESFPPLRDEVKRQH